MEMSFVLWFTVCAFCAIVTNSVMGQLVSPNLPEDVETLAPIPEVTTTGSTIPEVIPGGKPELTPGSVVPEVPTGRSVPETTTETVGPDVATGNSIPVTTTGRAVPEVSTEKSGYSEFTTSSTRTSSSSSIASDTVSTNGNSISSVDVSARLAQMRAMAEQITTQELTAKEGNFDEPFEGLLRNVGKFIIDNNFDPLHLSVVGPCYNCTVEGASFLERSGPANLQYEGGEIKFEAHVRVPTLYVGCKQCFIKVLKIPVGGKIELSIWGLAIYAKISQKIERGASPNLLEFKVEDSGLIDANLDGGGVIAPVLELPFTVIRPFIQVVFGPLLQEIAPSLIREQLKGFSLPIGK